MQVLLNHDPPTAFSELCDLSSWSTSHLVHFRALCNHFIVIANLSVKKILCCHLSRPSFLRLPKLVVVTYIFGNSLLTIT